MKFFPEEQAHPDREPQKGKTKAQLITELRNLKAELNQSRQDRASDLFHLAQKIRENYVLSGQQAAAHNQQMLSMIGLLNGCLTKALIYANENAILACRLGIPPLPPLNERTPTLTHDRQLLGFFYHEFNHN